MSPEIPPDVAELVDERVCRFAQAAQKHLQTNDLVILLDLMEPAPQLQAVPRQGIVDAEDVPALLRLKLSSAASAPGAPLGSPDLSFWFLVIYETGDADCVALNAAMLAAGESGRDPGDAQV